MKFSTIDEMIKSYDFNKFYKCKQQLGLLNHLIAADVAKYNIICGAKIYFEKNIPTYKNFEMF
jgi:hypothetical protein